MNILKAWVTDWPGLNPELNSGLVTISMRFDLKAALPHLRELEFPASKADPTLQKHLSFGLIECESLTVLRDAINAYLEKQDVSG